MNLFCNSGSGIRSVFIDLPFFVLARGIQDAPGTAESINAYPDAVIFDEVKLKAECPAQSPEDAVSLSEAELRFIDFLIGQAIETWKRS